MCHGRQSAGMLKTVNYLSITAEVITGDALTNPRVAMLGFYSFASCNW